ncbi:hypothetical protein, partial [Burkholderia cenocepacia]|uniref:hypothetical protein n=1 Tax=Burkholderia cenocepacia TaxID=95486 RepID=UPI002858E706
LDRDPGGAPDQHGDEIKRQVHGGNPENRVNRDPDYAAARRVPIVRNCGLFRRAARAVARPLILGAS